MLEIRELEGVEVFSYPKGTISKRKRRGLWHEADIC